MPTRRLTPFELSLDDATVDLTAAAATTYSSPTLDMRNSWAFTAVLDITETGSPTAGECKITIEVTDRSGNTVYDLDVVTAIDTQTNGSQTVFTWGQGNTSTVEGSGTLGTSIDALKVIDHMQVVIEVTTQNDGTTSTGALTLLVEDF